MKLYNFVKSTSERSEEEVEEGLCLDYIPDFEEGDQEINIYSCEVDSILDYSKLKAQNKLQLPTANDEAVKYPSFYNGMTMFNVRFDKSTWTLVEKRMVKMPHYTSSGYKHTKGSIGSLLCPIYSMDSPNYLFRLVAQEFRKIFDPLVLTPRDPPLTLDDICEIIEEDIFRTYYSKMYVYEFYNGDSNSTMFSCMYTYSDVRDMYRGKNRNNIINSEEATVNAPSGCVKLKEFKRTDNKLFKKSESDTSWFVLSDKDELAPIKVIHIDGSTYVEDLDYPELDGLQLLDINELECDDVVLPIHMDRLSIHLKDD